MKLYITSTTCLFLCQNSHAIPPPLIAQNENKILFEEAPDRAPPVLQESENTLQNDLNEKFKSREKTTGSSANQQKEEKIQKEKENNLRAKNNKIIEEAQKDRAFQYQLSASLVLSNITTSGNKRKNYTSEPTASLMFYRAESPHKSADIQRLWWGFRYLPFYGSASYSSIRGRYCFSTFGPMIGIGNLADIPQSVSEDAIKSEKTAQMFTRFGYFWMSGISAQQRSIALDEGTKSPGGEFKSKGVDFNAPAIWSEFTVFSLDYNASSTNYTFGMQLSSEKLYAYLAVGIGLWD